MPIALLANNPFYFVAWISAILLTLSMHEFSHAYSAHKLGDNTAREAGRLTLNPLAHIDWLGLLALALIGFGWGKPVPVNPYNLKFKKWGNAVVSLAGPFANLIGIFFFGGFLKILSIYSGLAADNLLIQFLYLLIIINAVLLLFNLIPIPPLDGSKLLFTILDKPKFDLFKARLTIQGPMILFGLIILDTVFRIGIFSRLFSGVIDLVLKIFS